MKHKIKIRTWIKFSLLFSLMAMSMSSCVTLETMGLVEKRPNIILILTDDMDFSLVPHMPHTQELITEQGATFTNYFVTTPLCCPSRTSMFRGQYAHNTNIMENSPGFRNFFRNGREDETIATWLSKAGYKTSLIGKYLNGYPITAGGNYVPPGWSDWHSFFHHGPESDEGGYYFDYTLNENGKLVDYGSSPEDYSTDVLKEKSLEFIDYSVNSRSPFFLLISLTAPHGPSIPAPRHEKMLLDLEYPQKPSFSETVDTNKPAVVLDRLTIGDEFGVYDANAYYVWRSQTLLAVDEMVMEIMQSLKQNGQLENTYIIFTSDNGFHMGEHGFAGGKGMPYTEDINVPFMVRGPGIVPNSTITQMAANIDLAPTIAAIAQAKTSDFVDGRSILPLLQSENTITEWRNGLLVEAGYTINRESRALIFRGIRTETFLYVEYESGEIEYYDLVADPYEISNIAGDLDSATLSKLHAQLEQLKACKADTCRALEETLLDQ